MSTFALITNRCPRCEKGKMFRGIFKMNESCPECHFKFERQEGYFTMAIVFANFLYAFIVAPVLLVMTTMDETVGNIILVLGGISLVTVPLIFRYARTIWLHFDFSIHPE